MAATLAPVGPGRALGQAEAGDPRLAVRVRRVPGSPVVTIRLITPGGTRQEWIPGQALLTGRLLTEGTRRRDWRRLADDVDGRGMILNSSASFESHGISLDALAADWQLALEWAAEVYLESTFPEDRVGWLARQTAAELESLADQPEVRTAWGFLELLYGSHPRGRPIQGTPESLAALRSEHCLAFHHRAQQAGTILAMAGDLDEDRARAAIESLFGDLAGPAEPWPEGAPPDPPPEDRRQVRLEDADQAHLYLGHLTVPRTHPAAAALEILGVILGSGTGLTGRIPQRIREKEGLAYSAHAETLAGAGLEAGRLVAYAGTAAATVVQAEAGIREEISRLREDGIRDEELEEARAYLLGREAFRQETARQWTALLTEAAFYGLPVDQPGWRRQELLKPDRRELESVAREHFHPEALRVTTGVPVAEP